MEILVRFTLGLMASLGISTPPEGREVRAVAMFWGVLGVAACIFLLAVLLVFHILLGMKQ